MNHWLFRVIEVLGIVLALAGILLLTLARRKAAGVRATSGVSLVARRAFLNRAMLGFAGVFAVAFGGGSIGFVWPNELKGFGKRVRVGKLKEILARIRQDRVPYYNSEGRFYLVAYDTTDPSNRYVREGVAKDGVMALYQKCAHLGCRVPFCEQSQWFECPCHASKYNAAGEKMLGPATAGLWRFPVEIDKGIVFVDTSDPKAQPEIGTDTLHQPPAGPFCGPVRAGE